MQSLNDKEKAIDEIVKIIQDFQYNDELSEKYKREILDKDKYMIDSWYELSIKVLFFMKLYKLF